MADLQAAAKRVARFREVMAQRGYDAVVLRHNPDLRWLTDAERVFDFEQAHTAFITQDELFMHTDSRYYNTFLERLGADLHGSLTRKSQLLPSGLPLILLRLVLA